MPSGFGWKRGRGEAVRDGAEAESRAPAATAWAIRRMKADRELQAIRIVILTRGIDEEAYWWEVARLYQVGGFASAD